MTASTVKSALCQLMTLTLAARVAVLLVVPAKSYLRNKNVPCAEKLIHFDPSKKSWITWPSFN